MKNVKPLEIIGNPTRVDQQVACPGCSARAMLFSDGSVFCTASAGQCTTPDGTTCWAPEPSDGDKWRMRQEFDRTNGIQPADRLITPTMLQRGLQPNMPGLQDRR